VFSGWLLEKNAAVQETLHSWMDCKDCKKAAVQEDPTQLASDSAMRLKVDAHESESVCLFTTTCYLFTLDSTTTDHHANVLVYWVLQYRLTIPTSTTIPTSSVLGPPVQIDNTHIDHHTNVLCIGSFSTD